MPTQKLQNFMVWKKIRTEKVIDEQDMFQYRFREIDEFGWWDLERV